MFVLKDSLESVRRGKPVYFSGMGGIGPRYTVDLQNAVKFDSKKKALQCPAFAFPLCFFEPVEI